MEVSLEGVCNKVPDQPISITLWRITASCELLEYTAVPHPWKEWADEDHWVLIDDNGFRTKHQGKRGKDFFATKAEATAIAIKKIEKKICRLKKKAERLQENLA